MSSSQNGALPMVEFIPFLPPGAHPGMDTVAFGLADELESLGCALRLRPMKAGHANFGQAQAEALAASLEFGADAVVLFVLDPTQPAREVEALLSRGVPVVTIHRPDFPVSGTVLVLNFYHGVMLSQRLARELPRGARVALIGGPQILDDEELVLGLFDGAKRSGLHVLNDPFEPRFRNLDDVRGAGRGVADLILDEFYPFDGLIVFNDETLYDVLEAIDERGLSGKFPVVSRNGSPHAVAAVKESRSLATLDYGLTELGRAAARLVVAALADPTVRGLVELPIIGTVIDKSNAEAYVPWNERATARELVVV